MNEMISRGVKMEGSKRQNKRTKQDSEVKARSSSSKLVHLAGSKLKKWEEYESMLRKDKKRAFRQLKRATGAYRNAIVESNEPNIAVPILLSMVVELKSQLDRVEDELEVLKIKNKIDSSLNRDNKFAASAEPDRQATAEPRAMGQG